jgi:hypothetical protein
MGLAQGASALNGKIWKPEHTDTLRRMAGQYTDEEIASQTGHCRETVTRRRLALGLSPCHRVDWTRRSWPRFERAMVAA